MKKFCIAVALAFATGVVGFAQGTSAGPTAPQTGPDLSGRWTRESASGAADNPGWGPLVEIKQSGVYVTTQPPSGKPRQFRIDGKETTELASVEGCKALTRITKSETDSDRVTITTWLVSIVSAACFHGKLDCDELDKLWLQMAKDPTRRPRRLESITVVSRNGDALTVDTTRSVPGDAPVSTTTTYRK